jgi:ribosomal protein L32
MRRVSGDYVATKVSRCEICQRAILPGMYCFDVELRSGRRALAHSLCEEEYKKT